MTEREDLSRVLAEAWPATVIDHQRAALVRSARLLDVWLSFWRRVLQ